MERREVILRIGGAAGDGVASAGETFAKVCSRSGLHVFGYNYYQSAIRGGHVWLQVRAGEEKVYTEGEWIDLLIGLNQDTLNRYSSIVEAGVIYNSEKLKLDPSKLKNGVEALPMPLTQLASRHGVSPIMQNTVAMGAIIKILKMNLDVLMGVLKDTFGAKSEAIVKANVGAAQAGYEYAEKNLPDFNFNLGFNSEKRMLITGNQAMALAALAAGCKFYSAYPMTPASSILHWMAAHGPKYGIVVKQGEDEIAVLNMAIGAGYAGARAMCATSGGGFSLMTEAVGLAGMTETPVVIVEAQRGGPSTGLPTKTEQADLFQMLGASQGDFPKVVIAPYSPEDCFNTIPEAFNIAERYQVPVIVASDLYLSEHLETVESLDLNVSIDRGLIDDGKGDERFLRYRITEDGVSPRAFPGQEGHMFVAGSDEHWEDSTLISDWFTDEVKRAKMMEKRMKKMKYIVKEFKEPKLFGDEDADLTFIGWGSTYGVIREAMNRLKKDGVKTNHLHIKYLRPFQVSEIAEILNSCKKTLDVENNYSAQLAKLIRMETGYNVDDKLLKYDGEPFQPHMLIDKVRRML